MNTIVNTSDSLQVDVTMEPVQHLMESSMEDDTVDMDISDDDTAASVLQDSCNKQQERTK